VRNKLVGRIVAAYESYEPGRQGEHERRRTR
jgi:hypothetical protein